MNESNEEISEDEVIPEKEKVSVKVYIAIFAFVCIALAAVGYFLVTAGM